MSGSDRLPGIRSGEIREAVRDALSQGCTWERGGDDHLHIWNPEHTQRIPVSLTATGKGRAVRNVRAGLKRLLKGGPS